MRPPAQLATAMAADEDESFSGPIWPARPPAPVEPVAPSDGDEQQQCDWYCEGFRVGAVCGFISGGLVIASLCYFGAALTLGRLP